MPCVKQLRFALLLTVIVSGNTACYHRLTTEYPVGSYRPAPEIKPQRSNIALVFDASLESLFPALVGALKLRGVEIVNGVPVFGHIDFRFVAEPIIPRFEEHGLSLMSHLWYDINVGGVFGPVGCGNGDQQEREMAILASLEISWDTAWAPVVQPKKTDLDPANRCTLGLYGDRTNNIRDLGTQQLSNLLERARDSIRARSSLRPEAEIVWKVVTAPFQLDNGLLRMNPREALASPFAGSGRNAEQAFSIVTYPEISNDALTPDTTALPALRPGVGQDLFVLSSRDPLMSFQNFSDSIAAKLRGTEFKNVRVFLPDQIAWVSEVFMIANGDTAWLVVTLGGVIRGTGYVRAPILIDSMSHVIRIGKLEYSSNTRTRLDYAVPWLTQRLLTKIQLEVDRFSWSVAADIESGREQLSKGLNVAIDSLKQLSGTVDSVSTPTAWADSLGRLQIYHTAFGRIRLTFRRGRPKPQNDEFLALAVRFDTKGDNKDREEVVEISVQRGGVEIAHREVGHSEIDGFRWKEWTDNTAQGPFYLPLPEGIPVTACGLSINVHKRPYNGNDWRWKVEVHVFGYPEKGPLIELANSGVQELGNDKHHGPDWHGVLNC